MSNQLSAMTAVIVFLGGTGSIVGFALMWSLANRRRSRANPHMTGRAAAPYWHSPTGLQDERGIKES